MVVYYTLLVIILYLGVLKIFTRESTQIETALLWIGIIALFVFAATRSIRIGADTSQYCRYFLHISKTGWFELLTSYSHPIYGSIELGYRIYNKLLSWLGGQQIITVANSFLQMSLIAILILRDSRDRYLSLLLYFTFCFYQTALNLTPSSFTSYFMFLSFPLIQKKRLIPFLLWAATGAMFHLSAIFFLPLYFINSLPLNKKTFILFLGGAASLFVFYVSVLPTLLVILPPSYRIYISTFNPDNSYSIQFFVYVVQLLPILFILWIMDQNSRLEFARNNSLMIWTFLFESVIYFMARRAAMFSRGAFLFSPYVIILLPQMISEVKSLTERRVITAILVFYSVAVYIVRVKFNNVGTTMPYAFYWNDFLLSR